MFGNRFKATLPTADKALPGREQPIIVTERHHISDKPLVPPFPQGMQLALFGLGCFWGAERRFWQASGVYVTAVGYAAGSTPNPTYEEICSGRTGHSEVVRVVFDPSQTTYGKLLKVFWESHDPTQGMRQGNDVGTQYRSGVYCYGPDQQAEAEASRDDYQSALNAAGLGRITTEILPAPEFYYAETYHQQYLAKNSGGYCGLGGTGVTCAVGLTVVP